MSTANRWTPYCVACTEGALIPIPRLALQVRATSRLWSGLRRDEAVATCIQSRTNGSDDVLDVRAGGPQDSPQRDAGYGCVVSIRLGRSTGRDLSVLPRRLNVA